jgi:hypothetical protein
MPKGLARSSTRLISRFWGLFMNLCLRESSESGPQLLPPQHLLLDLPLAPSNRLLLPL